MSAEEERIRMENERAERKAQLALRRFGRMIDDPSRVARPTSSKRHEQLLRSYSQLDAPERRPVEMKRVQEDGGLGDTIPIVVVDNGEFKTGNFYIDGGLTLVEE